MQDNSVTFIDSIFSTIMVFTFIIFVILCIFLIILLFKGINCILETNSKIEQDIIEQDIIKQIIIKQIRTDIIHPASIQNNTLVEIEYNELDKYRMDIIHPASI